MLARFSGRTLRAQTHAGGHAKAHTRARGWARTHIRTFRAACLSRRMDEDALGAVALSSTPTLLLAMTKGAAHTHTRVTHTHT